ncbi:DUF5034 domain-containing protein [Pseudochryseolinea flava]|uniref:DUF5034 domain-containing protein n=1 Tax=Pseudochryseolinea flava TaxID=2059302 RepID=A0A364Y2L8_9BACT|nr:DUF5034 domain-containing protein [Pseudochryseolinea flava]RAW00347.1 hypothetical protein DQQ10_14940 [Pseudochryseolinea flava]
MKFKKILLLLLLPYMFEVLIACSTGDCDGDFGNTYQYTHKLLEVKNLDYSGTQPSVVLEGDVSKHAYGIRLAIQREMVARITGPVKFSVFSPLYATDCPPNEYVGIESIASIKVFTVNDFDDTHSAGSDVSNYFRVGNGANAMTLTKFLDQFGNKTIYLVDQLNEDVDLYLATAPESNTSNQFKVQVTFSDGRVVEKTVDEIDLVD